MRVELELVRNAPTGSTVRSATPVAFWQAGGASSVTVLSFTPLGPYRSLGMNRSRAPWPSAGLTKSTSVGFFGPAAALGPPCLPPLPAFPPLPPLVPPPAGWDGGTASGAFIVAVDTPGTGAGSCNADGCCCCGGLGCWWALLTR